MKEQPKRGKGRPPKVAKFTEAMHLILDYDINIVSLTDDEIRCEVNDLLQEEERVSSRTFEYWKAGNFGEREQDGKAFFAAYKKALRQAKKNLMMALQLEPDKWQRFAWIIERKFDEWNIRTITEASVKHSGTMKTEQHVVDYSKLSDAALEEIVKAAEQKPNE